MYYLQTSGGGFEFWDTFVHPCCKVIKSQDEYPFDVTNPTPPVGFEPYCNATIQ